MKKNTLIRFVNSLVLLPVMTLSLSMGGIHNANNTQTSQGLLVKKVNIETKSASSILAEVVAKEADLKAQTLEVQAKAIDGYFADHDMPLEGMGMKMAQEAEKNNLDWRLLPAITVRESTGGKHDCTKADNNAFGWGSCKISFKSTEKAIETVAMNLGGNNPSTSNHYGNKTTKEILRAYNPPSIVPRYAEQVISIMNIIGDLDTNSAIPQVTT